MLIENELDTGKKRKGEKNMRNPNRIPKTLSLIKEIWEKYPDLRLCQLIGNCFVYDRVEYLYYVEDDILIKALKRTYSKKKGKR